MLLLQWVGGALWATSLGGVPGWCLVLGLRRERGPADGFDHVAERAARRIDLVRHGVQGVAPSDLAVAEPFDRCEQGGAGAV